MFVSVTFERQSEREKPRGKFYVVGPRYSPILNTDWDSWRFSKSPCPQTANEIATYLVAKAKDRLDCKVSELKVISGHMLEASK